MNIKIEKLLPSNASSWDAYVHAHPMGTLYHLSGWKNVIEKTYGHDAYYLMAVNSLKLKAQGSNKDTAYELSAIRKDPSNSTNPNPKNSKNPINLSNPSNPTTQPLQEVSCLNEQYTES